jgi:hypothetical protein
MTSQPPSHGVVDQTDGRRLATTPPDEDGPVILFHLIRFNEGHEMARYEQVAGEVTLPHGVRPAAWFDVEGTIVDRLEDSLAGSR